MSKKKLVSMLLVMVMLFGFSTSLYAAQFDYGEDHQDGNGYFGFVPFWDEDDTGGGGPGSSPPPCPPPDPPGGGGINPGDGDDPQPYGRR